MQLAMSEQIRAIDDFARTELHIPIEQSIQKSGEAVACALRAAVSQGSRVVILAGKGNNGEDGYAAAHSLMSCYRIWVIDVFETFPAVGSFREKYIASGGQVLPPCDAAYRAMAEADALIDAVFGTGFHGKIPEQLHTLCEAFNAAEGYKIAVDIPLGVGADDGCVQPYALRVDETVVLSYMKAGVVSYPGRSYAGKLTHDTIGLPIQRLDEHFSFKRQCVDASFAKKYLPKRASDGNKGTFGTADVITGSEKYRGAMHLSLCAALRGGAGYVRFFGTDDLIDGCLPLYPEVLYHPIPPMSCLTPDDIRQITQKTAEASAVLIGCGSGCSEGVYRLLCALMQTSGGPLIIDADALSALVRYGTVQQLKQAKRPLILTPHPKEFSRLCAEPVETIQQNRLTAAETFAQEYGVILVLKGAGTVVTDGKHTYINTTGSTALSKAGSGDVLAGLITALCAQTQACIAAALAVYLHGKAADVLSDTLSPFGVVPSDLPVAVAQQIRALLP